MNNLAVKYGAGFTEAPDANYPLGGFKNETTPGLFNGTPYEKGWADDLNAFTQGLLKAAGITVSGTTDTVLVSQILQGLVHQVTTADFMVDSGAVDAYVLAPLTDNYAIDSYEDGMIFRFIPDNDNTGASVVDISGIGSIDIVDPQGAALTGGELVAGEVTTIQYDSASGDFLLYATAARPGSVVQFVSTEDGEVATGATILPIDNSIPQNTEGDEYMTLAITPKSVSNTLVIDVTINLANSSTSALMAAALFQDTTADALAAAWAAKHNSADLQSQVTFRHVVVAGTVAATTFKVRAGAGVAGTTSFNGSAAARIFGGVMSSSITITEIKA